MPHRDTPPTPDELATLHLQREDWATWVCQAGALVHARAGSRSLELRGYIEQGEDGRLRGWIGCSVTVYRPDLAYNETTPAHVNHSSSSSNDGGTLSTLVSIELLQLAVATAGAMDRIDQPRIAAEAEARQLDREVRAARREANVALASAIVALVGPGAPVRLTHEDGTCTGTIDNATAYVTVTAKTGKRHRIHAPRVLTVEVKVGGQYGRYTTIYERPEGVTS